MEKQQKETFFLKSGKGADAQGEPTTDGFVVFKGSKATKKSVPSMTPNFLRLRSELIENGIFTPDAEENGFELSEDYVFTSPSTAAAMILGRNANGLTEWKLKDGTKLKDFEVKRGDD